MNLHRLDTAGRKAEEVVVKHLLLHGEEQPLAFPTQGFILIEDLVIPQDGVEPEGDVLLDLETNDLGFAAIADAQQLERPGEKDRAREGDRHAVGRHPMFRLEALKPPPYPSVAAQGLVGRRSASQRHDVGCQNPDPVAVGAHPNALDRRRADIQAPHWLCTRHDRYELLPPRLRRK